MSPTSETKSYTEALRDALSEELARDPSVFLMGEDIGAYGGAFGVTRGLLDRYGAERVVDTPISEESFVGMAVGAALGGFRPVVEIMFMDFLTLVMDPMVNQAAKLRYVFGEQARCPLVLRTAGGGGRCYGPTHSQWLTGWFAQTPGIRIAVPATPADAKGLLKSAIRDDNPVLFVEHKMLYGRRGEVPADPDAVVPFGKARRVREGEDLTIVAWSWMCMEAEAAAEALSGDEISVDLIDMRTLCPLDVTPVIESVKRTGRLMIVDEACRTGSMAAEIGMQVFEHVWDYLDAPIKRVCTPDVPLSASPSLENAALPGRERIYREALELITESE